LKSGSVNVGSDAGKKVSTNGLYSTLKKKEHTAIGSGEEGQEVITLAREMKTGSQMGEQPTGEIKGGR